MSIGSPRGPRAPSPPPERGRSVRQKRVYARLRRAVANRVGVTASHFNRTTFKTATARRLRRDSTRVEMQLWQKLRNRQLGLDFRRQHPAGPFVLDFYCPSLRLAIELDGGQHAEAGNEATDHKRDQWLAERGVTVMRFWNSDAAQNLTGVMEVIAEKILDLRGSRTTPTRRWRADLPLSGGGGPNSRQP
jgi:very-short-patch-repair endonuclease